ncbi:MAG: glutamate--tRNA ligase [Acidobacteria bacterium]|nr:glutamate--tRNA ligase [Acidobacteriota bacterium]
MTVRVRFAPSPTGHLHVGNVRTALFNWLYARKQDGTVILRIEDTDLERSTIESEQMIFQDMEWLGLDWDEGPDKGGEFGPYRQSERQEIYAAHAQQLLDEGKAYYCFCTPEELEAERVKAAAENRPPKYNRKCLSLTEAEVNEKLASGIPASIRFKTPDNETVFWYDIVKGKTEIPTDVIGDQIIVRASGVPRYNFAVVIDDHLMEISHIVRGDDHVPNTPLQLLIFRAFGWEEPKFAHLSMIVGEDHARLSKRHGATSVNQFREQGYLHEAFINYLALLGWSPGEGEEKLQVDKLIEKFSLKKVNSSPAVFDVKKLNWLNAGYIHELDDEKLANLLIPVLQDGGFLPGELTKSIKTWMIQYASAVKTNLVTINDVLNEFKLLTEFEPSAIESGSEEYTIITEEGVGKLIGQLQDEIGEIPPVDKDKYREMMGSLMSKAERKGKKLFHPIRIAVTGRLSGMELDFLIPLLETGSKLDLPVKILPLDERLNRIRKHFFK